MTLKRERQMYFQMTSTPTKSFLTASPALPAAPGHRKESKYGGNMSLTKMNNQYIASNGSITVKFDDDTTTDGMNTFDFLNMLQVRRQREQETNKFKATSGSTNNKFTRINWSNILHEVNGRYITL